MNKRKIIQRLKDATYRKNSVPDRVVKLLIGGEFVKPLDSADLCELINEGYGKKIQSKDIGAHLQPLLNKGVLNSIYLKNQKLNKRVWFPAWIGKKDVKKDVEVESEPILLFRKLSLHKEIIKVSESLFKNGHYAQAVLEAAKRLNNYVKLKSETSGDGVGLMSRVFSKNSPVLKLNSGSTQTETDEQEGYMHLFMGAMLGIRNPKAHENIVLSDPYKALHFLSFLSLLFQKVDKSKKVENAINNTSL